MRRCTDVTIILDKSDSMRQGYGGTVEMVNSFIEDRRKDPEPCVMSLVQFSAGLPYGDPLSHTFDGIQAQYAPRLTDMTYRLDGMTALFDAVALTIDSIGQRLAATPESERPDRVLIIVMTDGKENDSKRFNREDVMKRVNHQRDAYRWEFMYLGADMDSVTATDQARLVGIHGANAANYNKSSSRKMSGVLNRSVGNYAGPMGLVGPAKPTGPGIYGLDSVTETETKELREEADAAAGKVTPPPAKKFRRDK